MDIQQEYDDIKAFAGKYCLDIFHDYTWEEVCEQCPPSVQGAWETGKAIANLKAR